MFSIFRPALILLLVCLCSLEFANAEQPYLEVLKADARNKNLATRPEWNSLLHYAPHYLGLIEQGEVDEGNFYQAPSGKRDKQAELESTLDGVFRTDIHADDHPQCKFPARYAWLKRELKIDPAQLQEEECPRFKQWMQSLNPGRITLVFPASYLNNPSSMFGHTLMRIDPEGQTESERLTSYGVNYGANTAESQGLLFALKGMFGGYGGGFSVAPYYRQVSDYSDIENRDVWEYELNLSKEEIRRLMFHLWEIREVSFDYYFFDENCSYHLLSLLENARPSARLRHKTSVWVIPVDSVRAVLEENGILNRAVFRPSSKKVLDYRFQQLTPEQKEVARHLGKHSDNALNELSSLDSGVQSKVLDAGIDYLTYRTFKDSRLLEKEENYQYKLLSERSKLPVADHKEEIPAPARPDLGHNTNRFSLGLGTENRKSFYEIAFRPAYHDLLDPEAGYAKGAQLQFFGTKFRQMEGENLKLEKFDMLDILSLSPWDEVFKGFSWRVSTGLQRERFGDNNRHLAFNFDLGAGITVQPSEQITLFALLGPQLLWSEKLEAHYNFGVGPVIGGLFNPLSNLRLLIQASGGDYFGNSDFYTYKYSSEIRYTFDKNLAVRAKFERGLNFGDERWENWATTSTLSVQTFF